MKVLIVGSGGREHAMAHKIAESPLLTKLYAAPGNAGIAQVAECIATQADDISGLIDFAKRESIDLTVVGPEAPLVAGIVDRFEEAGLKIFGPSKEASQLEGSKSFSKHMMSKFQIPTADYHVFSNVNEAKHYVCEAEMPIVIKADGLAAGKGVFICETSQEGVDALNQIMAEGIFGEAGTKVVIEEMLEGQELSILALSDGKTILPLASSQDHKRAYDHDKGPNTGGMGAYSPCPQIPDAKIKDAVSQTVKPLIEGMAAEGKPYKGILYAGLMMTASGPYVLEYNCRFGDPETQAVLPRLKTDLLKLMTEIASGRLETTDLEWDERSCLSVVLASGGYPGHYDKGFVISGLDRLRNEKDLLVFHAGTSKNEAGDFITSGGRVLAVSGLGKSLKEASDLVYNHISKIEFKDRFYRKDIGKKALEVHHGS